MIIVADKLPRPIPPIVDFCQVRRCISSFNSPNGWTRKLKGLLRPGPAYLYSREDHVS